MNTEMVITTAIESTGIWPSWAARRAFEAQMLEHHASELDRRYPKEIWPTAGKPGPESQAAFVAGIRFACDQMLAAAAEIRDDLDTIDHEATS